MSPGTAVATDPEPSAFLIGREVEAQRIAAFVLQATGGLVVLYGEPASGKTMLVKRWLLPTLRAASRARRVFYAPCDSGIPAVVSADDGEASLADALQGPSLVVLDEFDRILEGPREARRHELEQLFETMKHRDPQAMLVAVVSARQLTSIYALSSYDPSIVNGICEVQSVGLAEGLEELGATDSAARASYDSVVLAAIREEANALERRGIDVTFDFLGLLHARFARSCQERGQRPVDELTYQKLGGVKGILQGYVEEKLEDLDAREARGSAIARGVLHILVEAESRGARPDFAALAPRLAVSSEAVEKVVALLVDPARLLVTTSEGRYRLQPPQIVTVVEEDLKSRRLLNQQAQRIVEEGLRSWQLLGTFLPPSRFAEVHRQRTHLAFDDELTRFLAQAALRMELPELAGAAEYWIRRLSHRDEGIDILLSAALDQVPEVRLRAVAMLGEYKEEPEPVVRERLAFLALTDSTPAVRAVALTSLTGIADEALLDKLLQEVRHPESAWREPALEALRLFPRDDVALLLQSLVKEPDTPLAVRDKAISVLAALNIPASVNALVAIALDDEDEEDRHAAAAALASTKTTELNQHLLARLAWRRPTTRMLATAVLLVLAAVFGMVWFWSATYGFISRASAQQAGWFVVGLFALPVVTGIVLAKLRKARREPTESLRWGSPLGVLAVALFLLCSVSVIPMVHGLAHVLARRVRRGLALFGLSLLGFAFVFGLAGLIDFVPFLGPVAVLYRTIGWLLLIGTYFYDVVGVAFGMLVFKRVLACQGRRVVVYQSVFRNPAFADVVLDRLRSEEPTERRAAKRLLRRFGPRIPQAHLVKLLVAGDALLLPQVIRCLRKGKDDAAVAELEGLWSAADEHRRRAITAILSRPPTPRSLEALERLKVNTGLELKARAGLARLQFRIAVWPRYALVLAAALSPALLVSLFHGVMITQNHAWAQIIMLKQPGTTRQQKVEIVHFLFAQYRTEAAGDLAKLFREGRSRNVTAMHAALAQGLIAWHLVDGKGDPRLRNELAAELPRFQRALTERDSVTFEESLGALQAMAGVPDRVLGDSAVRLITAFIAVAPDTAELPARKARALQAFGGIGFARALPALSGLLRARNVTKATTEPAIRSDIIRHQIDTVATQAYTAAAQRRDGREKAALLDTLKGLEYFPPELKQQLAREVADSTLKQASCDLNGDKRCDAVDAAYGFIAESPGSEDGYRDLLSHFEQTDQYPEAVAAFTLLSQRHRSSIWPHKAVAEIEHEVLALTDPASFQRSYLAMQQVRGLPAYQELRKTAPTDYARIEADYAEITLTAGQYEETDSVARDLLAVSRNPVHRLNMALFLYIGAVMAPDLAVARVRLQELQQVVESLPGVFYNNWKYPGTEAFIRGSELPQGMKSALLALCRGGRWYSLEDATRILEANRKGLEALSQTAPRRPGKSPDTP